MPPPPPLLSVVVAPSQLLAGAGDGEIGLLDTHELFSTSTSSSTVVPDGDSSTSSSPAVGRDGPTRRVRESTTRGKGETPRVALPAVPRSSSRHSPHKPRGVGGGGSMQPMSTGTAMGVGARAAEGEGLETSAADGGGDGDGGGEPIPRGFAKAMDAFEVSLSRDAAEAEVFSGGGSRQQAKGGGAGAAAATAVVAVAPEPGALGTPGALYRPVVRGLGMPEQLMHGEGARGSLSCLCLCARKPLIAGIARRGVRRQAEHFGRGGSGSAGGGGNGNGSVGVDVGAEVGGNDGGSESGRGEGEKPRHERPGAVLGAAGVEIQVWNYRTKRPLVRHRFGEDSSGGGSDEVAGGAGEMNARKGEADANGGGDGGGGGGDAVNPVAISFHPSGDSIAVAFRHYVNVFYIVGGGGGDSIGTGGGDNGDGDGGGSGGGGDGGGGGGGGHKSTTSSTDALSVPLPHSGAALSIDAAELAPLAVLRSDQREFMTKGMFSAAGELDPVINHDPISALHYSPGGHLLAVVTGKVLTACH